MGVMGIVGEPGRGGVLFLFWRNFFLFRGKMGAVEKIFSKKFLSATAVSRACAYTRAFSASLEINSISLFLPLSFILLLRARV